MLYDKKEVLEFISDNDVKFIRLVFTDVFGNIKNISVLSSQLSQAIDFGVSIDASAIKGFCGVEKSNLFLFPDLDTLSLLPWRPQQGRVARFYCNIFYHDLKPFELDGRMLLKNACLELKKRNIDCFMSSECEFYLFKNDEYGNPTNIPLDKGGYLEVAPDDKGENVRREICLTLENMNIVPETSHHEEGPGQNEIDFRYSNPLDAADNLMTVKTVIKTISSNFGLTATFNPKPIKDAPGNGLHINISLSDKSLHKYFMAGIMNRIKEITLFLNSTEESYLRLGTYKAPKYITWSHDNRSLMFRVPSFTNKINERFELRSPDGVTNPYIAYTLLIYAGLEGIDKKLELPEAINIDLYKATTKELENLVELPCNLAEAIVLAKNSEFVSSHLPLKIIEAFTNDQS